MTDDPRIGAAVEVVSREIHVRDWHKGHARRGCALCLGLATRVIQAADAVDPAREALRALDAWLDPPPARALSALAAQQVQSVVKAGLAR